MTPILVEERGNCVVAWCKGPARQFYEDSFRMLSSDIPLVRRRGTCELFAVFDGMGSAPQGRRAAQFLADTLTTFFEKENEEKEGDILKALLLEADLQIHSWGKDEHNRPLGGAVGTVMRIFDEQAELFHVGDTRAIRLTDEKAEPLTSLHQAGDGAVTRFFGQGRNLKLEYGVYEIEEGDRIVLCSDGISGVLRMDELAELGSLDASLKDAAHNIARRAVQRGSKDDVTALVYEVVFE